MTDAPNRPFPTKAAWINLGLMLVLLPTLALVAGCDDDTEVSPPPPPSPIRLGALLDVTGSGSSFGHPEAIACSLAVLDLNDYLASSEYDYEVELVIENSEGQPDVASQRLANFARDGYQYVVGPSTSANAEAVQDYAVGENVLLNSPSSVAISLADSTDTIYRMAPDDSHQADAITAYMQQVHGVQAVVTLYRGDVWGDDLFEATQESFTNAGMETLGGFRYPTDTQYFTAYLDSIENVVLDALQTYPDSAVAVYLLTFSEAFYVFDGLLDHTFSAWEDVRWYGASAVAKSSTMTYDQSVADIASIRDFTCPVFAEQQTDDVTHLRQRIRLLIDEEPGAYAFAAYDATWLGALTYIELNDINPAFADFRQAFLNVSDGYEGLSGVVRFNAYGDRANGDYDFWQLGVGVNNEFIWGRVAVWDVNDDGSGGSIVFPE